MGVFAAVRAYAIRPYTIYHLFVGDSLFVGVVPFFANNCRGVSHTPFM